MAPEAVGSSPIIRPKIIHEETFHLEGLFYYVFLLVDACDKIFWINYILVLELA